MKRLIVVAMAALLAACSSNDEVDLSPAELVDIEKPRKVKVVWSDDVGSGAGETYELLPMASLNGRIYAVDSDGDVIAYTADRGKEVWDADVKQPVASGIGAAGDLVFLGTLKGDVIALDAETGEERWRAKVSSEVLAPPQGNGSEVVVQTLDGRLYAFSADDGSQMWMHDTAVPALTLRGTSTPLVTPSTVYAGFDTGKVVALSALEGIPLWEQRVAVPQGRSELERVIDINAAPLLVGELIYVGSYQGRLVAINRNNGRGVWAQQESTFNGLSAAAGYVFIATADDSVKAYDAATGQLVWSNDQLVRRKLGAPQTFGSFVAVADFEGYVHIMNQSDGQFVARRKVDGDGVRTPMLGLGDTLYVYGNSGDLEALNIR
ncbi:outer membrane protein assembly factor BamB [Pseudomaricurvus sp. HS19]|uniref:outer membrane protein assembly factor BamB n=1 Tax=Pseudomaricurvus sp. HS19 TaxID=2692626 RepID=UPI001369734D|nr:outer membrane protein assembly factor BamB [Pseudomaricurvus sp. HS19]MYM62992.1 outer membrane protein assembly factor BamB [Pseudomaricurvus sp. HS19]